MTRRLILLVLGSALLLAPGAMAADRATPDEARTMAVKAAEYLKANGPEQAFAAFDAKDGPWRDRDLYVSVIDTNGVMRAHGTNPGLIGRSVIDLRDVDGKAFTREIIAVPDTGWVSFKWQNPQTKQVMPKKRSEVRVGEYLVGVGAYVE